tara:strand:+ start:193 stop:975 length:783 start_codon:yes stop_codon:yes gene_type:complete
MATINLGAIKFNWKGAYNGATTYAVDDVVSSGGSSYVCILASTGNATSNGTYWELMAQAGTAGAEGGSTTLTTEGDILYRDGSGLQRLPKGTAGQVLQMNSGATAPEYATAAGGGGKVLQVVSVNDNVERATTNTSYITAGSLSLNITPASSSSKIFLMVSSGRLFSDGPHGTYSIYRDSTNLGNGANGFQDANDSQSRQIISTYLDSPSTSSQINYTVKFRTKDGSYSSYFNSGTSPTRGGSTSSAPAYGSFTAMEIGA